jgi:hypothetical protein
MRKYLSAIISRLRGLPRQVAATAAIEISPDPEIGYEFIYLV